MIDGIIVLGDCSLSTEIAGKLAKLGVAHNVEIVIAKENENASDKVQRHLNEIDPRQILKPIKFNEPKKFNKHPDKPYYRQKERW